MRKFIARYTSILLVVFLTSCGTTTSNKNGTKVESIKIDTTKLQAQNITDNNLDEDTTNYDYASFFIVVADTGLDYFILHKKMLSLNEKLDIPIDTMGRSYNKTKNLISLPDNDEDEMYAGDYFPRRFPSENLSLEYLNFYKSEAGRKTIALITGIYETEKNADNALTALEKVEKKAFKIKADIYIGCMH